MVQSFRSSAEARFQGGIEEGDPYSKDSHLCNETSLLTPAAKQCLSSNGLDLSLDHYALVYFDPAKGGFQYKCSPSLESEDQAAFLKNLVGHFDLALPFMSFGSRRHSPTPLRPCDHSNQTNYPDLETLTPVSDASNESVLIRAQSPAAPLATPARKQRQIVKRSVKRQPSVVGDLERTPKQKKAKKDQDGFDLHRKSLRILDKNDVHNYYTAAFEAFLQTNDRHLAKAWVGHVEPKKQTNHPYNGKVKKPKGRGQRGASVIVSDAKTSGKAEKITDQDRERTKPYWWPKNVSHKEPDHLPKPERVILVRHILCNLDLYKERYEQLKAMSPPTDEVEYKKYNREQESLTHIFKNVTAESLLEAARSVKNKFSPASAWHIIEKVIRVRQSEIRYNDPDVSYPEGTRIEVTSIAELKALRNGTMKEPQVRNQDDESTSQRRRSTRSPSSLAASDSEDMEQAPFVEEYSGLPLSHDAQPPKPPHRQCSNHVLEDDLEQVYDNNPLTEAAGFGGDMGYETYPNHTRRPAPMPPDAPLYNHVNSLSHQPHEYLPRPSYPSSQHFGHQPQALHQPPHSTPATHQPGQWQQGYGFMPMDYGPTDGLPRTQTPLLPLPSAPNHSRSHYIHPSQPGLIPDLAAPYQISYQNHTRSGLPTSSLDDHHSHMQHPQKIENGMAPRDSHVEFCMEGYS